MQEKTKRVTERLGTGDGLLIRLYSDQAFRGRRSRIARNYRFIMGAQSALHFDSRKERSVS